MTTTAIVTMVLICGLVWGGFATILVFAIRRERRKRVASDGENAEGS
ncbi:MAG: methionine/alanine import family NSS transporter small subunit [bacterium]|nr:methionine/alanine import family NSS transporter small subunit [bacterium]